MLLYLPLSLPALVAVVGFLDRVLALLVTVRNNILRENFVAHWEVKDIRGTLEPQP